MLYGIWRMYSSAIFVQRTFSTGPIPGELVSLLVNGMVSAFGHYHTSTRTNQVSLGIE